LGYLPSQIGTFYVNLLSSAMGAFAVVLVALWAKQMFGRSAAILAAFVLLGSCTLTLHTSMVRVYPYQLATFAAVLLCVSFYKPDARWGLRFGFLLGIASATHTLFLAAGLFACVLLWENRRTLFSLSPWIMGGAFLGASLYLWIPLRAHLQPAFSWASPDGLGSLWSYLTQKQYGEKMFSRNFLGTWLFARTLARVFWTEWNPLAWLLGAWGILTLFRSAPRKVYAIAGIVLFNILLLYAYGSNDDLDILYRYFLPTYACVAVLAATGTVQLLEKIGWGFLKSFWARILLGVLFLLLFISYPAIRWSDLSQSSACRTYLNNVLRVLPQNATAILAGDNQVFPCAYGKYVLGLRKDLHLVEWEGTVFPEAVRWLSAHHSKLTPEQLEDAFYRQNGGCLFISEHRVLPAPYHCRPWGFLYRLSDDESEKTLPPPPKPYWMPPHFTLAEKRDEECWGNLAGHYLMSSDWNDDQGNKDAALKDAADAVTATPRTLITLLNASVKYRKYNLYQGAEGFLLRALEIQPDKFETLLNLGILYGQMGRYDECRKYLLSAYKKKPTDPMVLHFLGRLDTLTQGGK
jgi:hypothetical protein